MIRRNRHKTITSVRLNSLSTGLHQRIVRAWERDPVHHHQPARISGNVNTLPEAHRAEQARIHILRELVNKRPQGRLPLQKHRQVAVLTHILCGLLGPSLRRKQTQRAAISCFTQFEKPLKLRSAHPKTGFRQIRSNIHDPLLGVVERRSNINPLPARSTRTHQPKRTGSSVKRLAHRKCGTRKNHRAILKQALPQTRTNTQRRNMQSCRVRIIRIMVTAVLKHPGARNPQNLPVLESFKDTPAFLMHLRNTRTCHLQASVHLFRIRFRVRQCTSGGVIHSRHSSE